MYKYETHMHTFPVSRCARATVEESVAYYKALGYDGDITIEREIKGEQQLVDILAARTYLENAIANA